MRPIHAFRFAPGELTAETARALSELSEAVSWLMGISTTPPLQMSRLSSGPALTAEAPPGFWARIDAVSGAAYGWTEMDEATVGTWVEKTSGRTGTTTVNPAYEVNGSAGVPVDSIVWMMPGFLNAGGTFQEYTFVADLSVGGTITGPVTFLDGPVSFGSTSQTAALTINVYGAPSFPTTWNFQLDSLTIWYGDTNYYGGNTYKSGSSSSYNAGSTTTFAASASLTFNNRPTFNNSLVLVGISSSGISTDGTLFIDLNNNLQWYCAQSTTFRFPPTAPNKPNLQNQLKVSFPPYSTTPGNRTSGTTPTLTLTDPHTNVTAEKIPGTSMVGFKFPGDLTNRTLSIQDTGNVFNGYTGGTIPTWRMRTWFYLINDPSAGGVDLITLGTPQFGVSAITSGTTFLVITVHGSPTETFNDGTSLSLNTLYSLEVWLDPSVGTNGTWYSSVNGAAPTSHAASNGFVDGGGFQSTLTLGPGATSRGYYLGPVEFLYSLPSGSDLSDWYNSGNALPYPYATSTTPMQAGSTGADLSQSGGPGSVLRQPSAGQGVVSGPLQQGDDTPMGRIKGYQSGW